MSSLTVKEQKQLVKLMNKLILPAPIEIFETWCRVFGVVVAEAAVIRNGSRDPELFLTYREDKFFKGWHIPGCIHLPKETIQNTLRRVLRKEIQAASHKTSFLGWFERTYGNKIGQSARGHETSFVFVCPPKHTVKESSTARFFPLKKLPKNIMHHQLPIITQLKKIYLQ